jgi:copper transport protein
MPDTFTVHLTRNGQPVRGATVVTRFDMLDMEMQSQSFAFNEVAPGTYQKSAPALVMVGHWGLTFEVQPRGKPPFEVILVDKASG